MLKSIQLQRSFRLPTYHDTKRTVWINPPSAPPSPTIQACYGRDKGPALVRAGRVVGEPGGQFLPLVLRQVADHETAHHPLQVVEVGPEDALPQTHRLVPAGGGERVPVGAEGDAQ